MSRIKICGPRFHLNPQHFFIVLCLLLIGGDLISIKIGGLTFRAVAILILGVWFFEILRRKGKVVLSRDPLIVGFAFCVGALISMPYSIDIVRTTAYTIWLLFTFIVVVPVFFWFGRETPLITVIRVWFFVYRFQVFLLIVELIIRFATGNLERPHLWFYETSYVAMYFAGYVGASMFLVSNGYKWARIDLALAVLAIVLLSSSTGFFAMIFAILINVLVSRYRIRLLFISLFLLISFFMVMHLILSETEVYRLLIGYLLTDDRDLMSVFFAILDRGGTRIVRFLWGIDAFLSNPWVGIGFGADQTYTATMPISPLADEFYTPWGDPFGNPFVNPFVEAAATMGIIGFFSMLILVIICFGMFRGIKEKTAPEAFYVKALLIGFFMMFFTLQIEGTFLRFYLWSTFGLACGAVAQWRSVCRA